MKKEIQHAEEFYISEVLNEEERIKTLESIISHVNSDGWHVDQIVPLSFWHERYSKKVVSGILLCSKIEVE